MALTGFDPDVVNSAISKFSESAHDVLTILCKDFKTQFVDAMATIWACKDAQDYFAAVKTSMDSLTEETEKIFRSVVDSMGSAGKNWGLQTGTSYTAPSFVSNRMSLDVSGIKENINGVRGIDLDAAENVKSVLETLSSRTTTNLTFAKHAVLSSGFIGGTSEANLQNSLEQIRNNIQSSFQNLTQQLNTAIDNTIANYSNTEGKIAQAFAGQE